MSLTSVMKRPETVAFLKGRVLRPPGYLAPPMRVPPAGADPTLLGIAFDYALRLGLDARHACEDSGWVADGAEGWLRHRGDDDHVPRAREVLDEASATLDTFDDAPELDPTRARACYLLAGLDLVVRPGVVDGIGREPSRADLAELIALYAVVPWPQFVPARRLILNPTFGEGSRLVGGGDADLVLDDLLIDVKTARDLSLEIKHLRQVVGYALLANFYTVDSDLPQEPITRLGLYLARAGALTIWSLEAVCPPRCQREIVEHLRARPREEDDGA